MKKLTISALAAVLATLSFAPVASATDYGDDGWNGHRNERVIIKKRHYNYSHCYYKRVKYYDDYGYLRYKRVKYCD